MDHRNPREHIAIKEDKKLNIPIFAMVDTNSSTYEEKISFKISRINVFTYLLALMFFIILTTSAILFFTPIREYIPGYSSVALQRQANSLSYKADSLQQIVYLNDQYINS